VQTAGEVWQGGRDISRLPPAQRDYGIVFQSYALFPNLSVADNVAYGLVNRRTPRAQVARRVTELLKLVGLPGTERKYPAQLSGGQQQRIALARALATSPGLLLLDEPLSALDALERVRLRQEIRALQQKVGVTTVMVTHDQEEALSVADRIVVMNQGVIEQVGTPMEVYREPATPFVADFVARRTCCLQGARGPSGVRRPAHPVPRPGPRRARVPAAGGRAGPADRTGRPARVRRQHREDRVPRLLLPRARGGTRAAAEQAHRLPVPQLPVRGPRWRSGLR
jgi:ABC-type sulfate/molybdate transport systems ATPase subunit